MKSHDITPHAEGCWHQWLAKTEEYARDKPVQAAALAFGAGLLLNLLPARVLVRPLTAITAKLLPSALAGLGIIKAVELCCGSCLACQRQDHHSPASPGNAIALMQGTSHPCQS